MTLNVPQNFLSGTEDAWLEAVDKALKGAPRSRLYGETDEGLEISPLYERRADVSVGQTRAAQKPWTVFQHVDLLDPVAANQQILDDLAGGASGLELVFGTSMIAGLGQGLQVDDIGDMAKLLDGVYLDLVKLRLSGGYVSHAFLAMILTHMEKTGQDLSALDVNMGSDPVSVLAGLGKLNLPFDELWRRADDTVLSLHRSHVKSCFYAADGRIWHNGGASQAEELACVMASCLTYLRAFAEGPVPYDLWSQQMSVVLVAEADQVGTIAKARAARRLWACILDACGLEQTPLSLHMQTSYRMLANKDPWVNLLRNTVAAFAAGVGGADSLTVLPHTKSIGLPDAFARRLARNTQSILLEESNLHMVADPSAGSGAIEARTEALTNQAWDILQSLEAEGGIIEALQSGQLQERIAVTRSARDLNVARRKRPITGVSEYPLLSEKPVSVVPSHQDDLEGLAAPMDICAPGKGERYDSIRKGIADGQPLASLLPHGLSPTPGVTAPALKSARLSEPFEALRERAEALPGGNPEIFLACLGPLAQFTGRASWVTNAFAAGGLATCGGDPADRLEDVIDAFRQSGTRMACLVSSDTVYEQQAATAAAALKSAGAEFIYLAGKPGPLETQLSEAGVDSFIFAGCNLLELLGNVYVQLGLTAGEELSA